MQLDFAFLARFADFLQSTEQLAAYGIGIDAVEASRIPYQASPISLVARLTLMPNERNAGHTYGLTVVTPSGDETVLCENETLSAKHSSARQASSSNLVLNLNVVYDLGLYKFRLILDGEIVKEMPLLVSESPSPVSDRPPNPEQSAQEDRDHLRALHQSGFDRIEAMTPSLDDLLSIAADPPGEWLDEEWT